MAAAEVSLTAIFWKSLRTTTFVKSAWQCLRISGFASQVRMGSRYVLVKCVLINIIFFLQPICQAAYNNDFSEVQFLLERNSNCLNIQDSLSGDTPLICACKQGNNRIVSYLLKRNADVNLRNKVSGRPSVGSLCLFLFLHPG